MKASFCIIVALSLTGCITRYAHAPISNQAFPDSSTPIQYQVEGTGDFTSGYLGKVTLADGKTYNAMTDGWHNQHPKVAATPFIDHSDNHLWAVSNEVLSNWYKSTLNP